jgi:hypothetical protein
MTASKYPNGFSGGLHLRNVPVYQNFAGAVKWVDSGTSKSSYKGTFDFPFLTIEAAQNSCTASNGDIIMLKPGHAGTVSVAAGLALDVAGITIIGQGSGSLQPTITLDTADTADIDIDAANITIENVHFIAGFADIAAMIDVNADDFTLRNCRFTQSAVDLNALVCVQDAAAGGSDRITIEGCKAIMYDASNTHFVNFAGTGTGHIVRNNVLHGDWGTMAVGGAGVVTYCEITGNYIANIASDSDACINLAATATGVVVGNHCAGAAAQANGVTATACLISQNYYGVIGEDLSAILDPIAT